MAPLFTFLLILALCVDYCYGVDPGLYMPKSAASNDNCEFIVTKFDSFLANFRTEMAKFGGAGVDKTQWLTELKNEFQTCLNLKGKLIELGKGIKQFVLHNQMDFHELITLLEMISLLAKPSANYSTHPALRGQTHDLNTIYGNQQKLMELKGFCRDHVSTVLHQIKVELHAGMAYGELEKLKGTIDAANVEMDAAVDNFMVRTAARPEISERLAELVKVHKVQLRQFYESNKSELESVPKKFVEIRDQMKAAILDATPILQPIDYEIVRKNNLETSKDTNIEAVYSLNELGNEIDEEVAALQQSIKTDAKLNLALAGALKKYNNLQHLQHCNHAAREIIIRLETIVVGNDKQTEANQQHEMDHTIYNLGAMHLLAERSIKPFMLAQHQAVLSIDGPAATEYPGLKRQIVANLHQSLAIHQRMAQLFNMDWAMAQLKDRSEAANLESFLRKKAQSTQPLDRQFHELLYRMYNKSVLEKQQQQKGETE